MNVDGINTSFAVYKGNKINKELMTKYFFVRKYVGFVKICDEKVKIGEEILGGDVGG